MLRSSLALMALMSSPALAQYGGYGNGSPSVPLGVPSRSPFLVGDSEAARRPIREWVVRPSLAVEETYTDNVRLRPAGQAHSDWVTLARPGISIARNGPRAQLQLDYAPQLVYRANEGTHDLYQYLNANGTVEVAPELFFVDGLASVTQQNVSILGPQAVSNVNNTGNRTSVRAYSVSPYLRHRFGSDAEGEARFAHNSVSYSSNPFFDSDAELVDTHLTSGPSFRRLTWNLGYRKEHINYTNSHQSVDLQRFDAGAKRLVTPTIGLRGNVGYEDNRYASTGVQPRGPLWSVGPEWTPTPRTSLTALVGHRYFGRTFALDFRHRTRLTVWNVQYTEDVSTTRGQFLVPTNVPTATYLDALLFARVPDPAVRQATVQSFMTQAGLPTTLTVPLSVLSTVPYLEKRWTANFGIQGVRNTVMSNVFHLTREVTASGQLGAGDFILSPNIRQTGASVLWSLRVTGQTTTNLTGGVTRSELPTLGRDDRLKYVRFDVTKRIQPRLTGMAGVRRLQNDSNQSAASYRENAVFVSLKFTF